jgi:hypothetical protein
MPKLGQGGRRLSQHKHTPLLTLRLNFDKNDGALSGKKGMGRLEEGHHSNKGRQKVKQLLKLVHVTNVQLKAPPNCQKKTCVIES